MITKVKATHGTATQMMCGQVDWSVGLYSKVLAVRQTIRGTLITIKQEATTVIVVIVIGAFQVLSPATTYGQTTGRGSRETGGSEGSSNAPLTYSARTDTCLNAVDINLATGQPCGAALALKFQGRNTCGLGCNGTAWTDLAPNVGGLNGKNTVITDPDFGTRIVRATDYSLSAFGSSFSTVSSGNQNVWASDSKLFIGNNSGGGRRRSSRSRPMPR
jgi:hypothetical protein